MRKVVIIFVLAVLGMFVTGCVGQMQVDMDTTIRDFSGKGSMVATVRGTGMVGQALKERDLTDYIRGAEDAGISVRRYMDNQEAVLELGCTFESIDQLNHLQAQAFDPVGVIPKVEQALNPGLFASSASYSVSFHSVNTPRDEGQNKTGPLDIAMTYSLAAPGRVITSNAVSKASNTATWTLSSGQMLSNSPLGMTTRHLHIERIFGILAFSILAGIFVIRKVQPVR